MKFFSRILLVLSFALFIFSMSQFVLADTDPNQEAIQSILPCFKGNCDSEQVASLPDSEIRAEFLPRVARILIYATGTVSLVVFFVAAAMFVFSSADDEKITKAKDAIIWSVVGIAFAAVAYILVKAILDLDI